MRGNRERWLDLLLATEGGYVNDPADPGRATKYGVTQATLAAWRGRPVTEDEVKALTLDEFKDVARARYWNVVKADELPGGLDLYVADFAYNSGPARAVRELQACLRVDVDGYCGEKTIGACRVLDTLTVLERLHAARLAFLQDLPIWERFGKGWTNRCERVLAEARPLVQANVVEAKVPRAALEGATIAALAVAIAELLPALLESGQQGYDAAAAGQWTVVATALATALGMAIRGFMRLRAHYQARSA